MKHLIVGFGVVGHNLDKELCKFNCGVYDKYKGIGKPSKGDFDVAWICVDTPLMADGMVGCNEVENAILENDCRIYVIKSTVRVGFVDELVAKTGKKIIFSPEYYGGTQHCNNFDFDFTILGGDRETCIEIQQELQKVYDGRHRFFIVDSKVAEMTKFMENAWLATKVSFCCDFFRACEKAGINYEDVRELFVADPRINPSHTFVYREKPKWDSHCLNKDVPSIANQFDMDLLKEIIRINEKY